MFASPMLDAFCTHQEQIQSLPAAYIPAHNSLEKFISRLTDAQKRAAAADKFPFVYTHFFTSVILYTRVYIAITRKLKIQDSIQRCDAVAAALGERVKRKFVIARHLINPTSSL